ncbi:hypothetical protein ACA910_007722 [Epithemia clementina (nom. ined.)]
MEAAVYDAFGGPIRIRRVPLPTCPRDGVIVHVRATGVCRSDWHGWKGHDDDIVLHGLPFIPGHEFSGVVVQLGAELAQGKCHLRLGDRVVVPFILSCGSCRYCSLDRPTVCQRQQQPGFTYPGSFAEYVAVPWAIRNVCKLPNEVSFIQAAVLGCRFTTAYRAVVQQGRLTAGECVAIFGSGGLGLSCIMIAKAIGAETIVAIDISESALKKARQLGATHTILVHQHDHDDSKVQNQVIGVCEGQGAHLSINCTTGLNPQCANAVYSTRRTGRIVQLGLPVGGVVSNGKSNDDDSESLSQVLGIPMDRVVAWELEIFGSHGFAAQDLPALLDMILSGSLDPCLLVERQVSLLEGARALEDMDRGSPLGVTMITKFRESKL